MLAIALVAAPSGGQTGVDGPTTGSLAVVLPCAERLIVRNRSTARITVENSIPDQTINSTIRPRDHEIGMRFASMIRRLPAGGTQGAVTSDDVRIAFDSRIRPPCTTPFSTAPFVALEDYMEANDLRSRSGAGIQPGLVIVAWHTALQRAAELKRSPLVGMAVVVPLVDDERSARDDPTTDSLEVLTPCAERVIIRNHGDSAARVEITVASNLRTATIRGRATNPRLPFFSLVRSLPAGGAEGIVRSAGSATRFDSRGRPSCVVSVTTTVPSSPPDDYMFANTEREQSEVGFFPGLVMILFKDEITVTARDSLLRQMKGSVVATSPQGSFLRPRLIVWFDDDDESAALAARRAKEFEGSGLTSFVVALPFGGIWKPPME